MKLTDKILSTPIREESGSKTVRKFQFQKDLSLLTLIKEHNVRDDYVFLFEFHDDLVIFDSEDTPSSIDFFQIKSKDSGANWTLNSLTKSTNDKLSILGKMYLNKINFPENTASINFISNSYMNLNKTTRGKETKLLSKFHSNELTDETINKVNAKLKAEHNLQIDPDFKNVGSFHVTPLSNLDSSTHCVGALSTLLNQLNPNHQVNSKLAYDQIINEITRKSKNTIGDKTLETASELYALKGITKKEFINYLQSAGLYKSIDAEWLEISGYLSNSNIDHFQILELKSAWRDLNIRLIKDANSSTLHALKKEIKKVLNKELKAKSLQGKSLIEMVTIIQPQLTKNHFEILLIQCLIIKIIHEQ